MINQVHIQNFKSIRQLTFNCRRINLIIGQPNTGKSNILEALSLLSSNIKDKKKVIRYREVSNLFYDNNVSQKILVETDSNKAQLIFDNNNYSFTIDDSTIFIGDNFIIHQSPITNILNYKYSPVSNFVRINPLKLQTPHGENLFELLYFQSGLKRNGSIYFLRFGL